MDIVVRKINHRYQKQPDKHQRQSRKMPKYLRLFTGIKLSIQEQELPANTTLPPTRELAQQLQLSRSSVIKAYDMLILEGYVIARQGSGYRVASFDHEVSKNPMAHSTTGKMAAISSLGQSFTQNVGLINTTDNKNIAFRPGLPPLDLFPVHRWKSLTNQYWRYIKLSSLTYSPSSGLDRLKSNLAKYLHISRGIRCDPQQVIIVSGSLQSLFLCGMALLDPGDGVVMENPTFPNVISIFRGLQAQVTPMAVDEYGANPSSLPATPDHPIKLIHTTPSCHYPMGYPMSLKRKLELIRKAAEWGSFIIENDYEHEINHADTLSPTLYSLDEQQRTIYMSTFNRLLHPSIRIGFMVVPYYLLETIEALLKHSHRFVPPSVQIVLNDFIERSYLHQHIAEVLKASANRKQLFEEQWSKEVSSGISLSKTPQRSLHVVAPLPATISDRELVHLLDQQGVVCHSLSKCYLTQERQQGLIFGYAAAREYSIPQKLGTVASAVRAYSNHELD